MNPERELLVLILGLDKADAEGRGFVELSGSWLTLDGYVANLTPEQVALIREIFTEIAGESQA